jgi:hypothetical protein
VTRRQVAGDAGLKLVMPAVAAVFHHGVEIDLAPSANPLCCRACRRVIPLRAPNASTRGIRMTLPADVRFRAKLHDGENILPVLVLDQDQI